MNKKFVSVCLTLSLLAGMAGIAYAADEIKGNAENQIAVQADENLDASIVKNEDVLILKGEWAKEPSYSLSASLHGKTVKQEEVVWSVDADSYKQEFGFTGKLTGDDIVSVNAETGEITAKNSGIVRVWCAAKDDPDNKFSVVVVVPGDIDQNGVVDEADVECVFEAYEEPTMVVTTYRAVDYQNALMDLDGDGEITMNDASIIFDLIRGVGEIQ